MTRGRGSQATRADLPPCGPPSQELRSLGAEVHLTQRGGDVTFHGPGQLVGYPVVHVRHLGCGARAYVEGLEDVMAATAARHGVHARGRVTGAPGVWVGDRKLGAVGVRISGGVSSHGFALNVVTDLRFFKHIVPCGIADKVRVTRGRSVRATEQARMQAAAPVWYLPRMLL